MSEAFKKKLMEYERGELEGEELALFEEELTKLEQYQEFLEGHDDQQPAPVMNEKKQRRIIWRGKWKARFQTALSAIGLFIVFTIIATIISGLYYQVGSPNRNDVYREIIDLTLTVTEPYGYIGASSGSSIGPYFNMDMSRDLMKKVGSESVKVGELNVKFLFSFMGVPIREYNGQEAQNSTNFYYPTDGDDYLSDWDQLEYLHEGTVVSAYVSFDQLMETRDVEALFADRDLFVEWYAVDTGLSEGNDVIWNPIGFPSNPIWHDDDMVLIEKEEEKTWFGTLGSELRSSPEYNEGNQAMLHEQFMKTLYFLKDHKRKAENLMSGIYDLEEIIAYLEENGVKNYGAVITGPTKEVLKLQDEPRIAQLEVDEVAFWNWE
ncbi:Sigma factor regulator N-terminal [Amphibacillus marinus]|uniref:Sigma factor regulator N-terminal n=2 Tax=Amphibacillus marinus TaxID=872970 RepID=A0A1H8KM22_9BACI|nr:Sigma factor regulator N-terminal [Amphibacillus marinus]